MARPRVRLGDLSVGFVQPLADALRELGHEKVDEASLFRMIGQMRDIVATARKATRKMRRDADRRRHLKAQAPPLPLVPPNVDVSASSGELPPASPFDEIEEW